MRKEVSSIYRTAIWQGEASLAVLDMTDFTAQAAARHRLSPAASRALGRVAACAAYLCSWIEEDERLSVMIEGGGELGKVHAFGNGALELCASAENPFCGGNDESVERLIGGNGYLTVTRDGGRGLPFSGTCELVNGTVTNDIAQYLAISEQRPTAVSLFEEVREGRLFCGGIFLQPLTGASPSALSRARAALQQVGGKSVKEILSFFGAENAERREILFRCSCSREKAERAILSAGREGAEAVIKQEGVLTVHCHECNTDYKFYEEDIRSLFGR